MIGLDTNVLVRYFAQDDPAQSAAATRLVDGFTAQTPGFVSTIALVETVWVLSKAYRLSKPAIADMIERLLRASELVVEDAESHYRALAAYAECAVDYADALIAEAGRQAGCEKTVTFDRRAASGPMRLLDS